MHLREALDLSSKRLAKAYFSMVDSPFNGIFHAMGGNDGSIFIGEAGPDGKGRLGNLQPITSMPEPLQHTLLNYDTWEPKYPLHPLEALAQANEIRNINDLFHVLWSKATHAKEYDENEWRALQRFIEDRNGSAVFLSAHQD